MGNTAFIATIYCFVVAFVCSVAFMIIRKRKNGD